MRRGFVIGLALGAASLATAQSFTNGGFESNDFTGWTITFTANGATAAQLVEAIDIDAGGPLGISPAGKFSVGRATTTGEAEGGLNLTQDLMLTAGETYTISYNWAAIRTITSANAEGGIFRIIVNGTPIAQQNAGSTSSTTPKYGFISMDYLATSTGLHTIGAQITRPFTIPTPTAPTLFQYVDNFSIGVVPEPASMAALGLGVAAVLRRRRRK